MALHLEDGAEAALADALDDLVLEGRVISLDIARLLDEAAHLFGRAHALLLFPCLLRKNPEGHIGVLALERWLKSCVERNDEVLGYAAPLNRAAFRTRAESHFHVL